MDFEYPEDELFFSDLLAAGDADRLEKTYSHLFDFRSPTVKRKEFNALRKSILPELIRRYEGSCGLGFEGICEKDRELAVDHFIPLSSNILNKTLRHLGAQPGRKVETQSFGSNHPDNLVLACSACNNHKKHRFPDKLIVERLLG